MKKIMPLVVTVLTVLVILGLGGVVETPENTQAVETTNAPRELKAGEVFEQNCYIEYDNVRITYDGENFIIDNNSDSIMMISCGVYGKKKDGTYDWIGNPAFFGIDEKQYEKDMEENGWAIKKTTNRVRPGESLTATMTFFDFGDDYYAWDIDEDGYYDISFTLSEQRDETSVVVSTADTETDYYRLKAE